MKSKVVTLVVVVMMGAIIALASSTKQDHQQPRRSGGRLVADPTAPSNAASLSALGDCEDLRSYLVEVAVETLISHHYFLIAIPWSTPGGGGEYQPSDYTTTNNQEEGVDELDLVKTDGTHLYVTEGEQLHILDSWPPQATHEVATVNVGESSHGLFLHGDTVLTIGADWGPGGAGFPRTWTTTRLTLLDVSDPGQPLVTRTIEVEGWLVNARLIDGDLFAVLRSYVDLPGGIWNLLWSDEVDWPVMPPDADPLTTEAVVNAARAILTPLVEQILDDFDVTSMLPRFLDRTPDNPDPEPTALLSCGDLFRSPKASAWSTLSVLHLDLDQPASVSAAGLLSDGFEVYASRHSLYVSQAGNWWWWGWSDPDLDTSVHKFSLDPSSDTPVRYVASGKVEGWPLDQFAFSEHDGHLRVASSDFGWWNSGSEPPDNRVTVLADDQDGNLTQVGLLGGIAPGERIFAVRFMADIGYIVTFERIDPLFTIDLSDPTSPSLIGELEVTGFSSYLHPVGTDWLLSIGMEADDQGQILGLALSVFDVRDLTEPLLAHRYLVEAEDAVWSWSDALHDHHAFTYHRNVLSIPAYIINTGQVSFSGLLVFDVDPNVGIAELGRVDHENLPYGWGGPRMRRSVYIEDALYSISSAGVKVNLLRNPEIELAAVPFEQ